MTVAIDITECDGAWLRSSGKIDGEGKKASAVVEQQLVGLTPVRGDDDIEVAVTIDITECDGGLRADVRDFAKRGLWNIGACGSFTAA